MSKGEMVFWAWVIMASMLAMLGVTVFMAYAASPLFLLLTAYGALCTRVIWLGLQTELRADSATGDA